MKSLWIATGLFVLSLLPTEAAVTVFVNNLDANTPVILNSAGNDLDETYSFDFGTFTSGFDPSTQDVSNWSSNWISLDTAINGNGWNTVTKEINLTGTVDASNVAQFPEGTQLYLWVYNTQTIQTGTEWALITDTDFFNNTISAGWTVPDVTGANGNPELFISDADTPIYGGVNDITSTGGSRSSTPTDFQIQTHAVTVAPVPEPGSCLLVGLAGLALRLRRRRSA